MNFSRDECHFFNPIWTSVVRLRCYFQPLRLTVCIIFLDHYQLGDKTFLSFFLIALIFGLAFLMVSTIRFRSFKTFNLNSRKPFSAVFIAILLIVVVAMEPETMLFCIGVLYITTAFVEYILYLTRRRHPSETTIEATEENK